MNHNTDLNLKEVFEFLIEDVIPLTRNFFNCIKISTPDGHKDITTSMIILEGKIGLPTIGSPELFVVKIEYGELKWEGYEYDIALFSREMENFYPEEKAAIERLYKETRSDKYRDIWNNPVYDVITDRLLKEYKENGLYLNKKYVFDDLKMEIVFPNVEYMEICKRNQRNDYVNISLQIKDNPRLREVFFHIPVEKSI